MDITVLSLENEMNAMVFLPYASSYRLAYIGKKEEKEEAIKKALSYLDNNARAKESFALFSEYGKGDYRSPSLLLRSAIGSYSTAFRFERLIHNDPDSFLSFKDKIKESLTFVYKDDFYDCELFLSYASMKGLNGFLSYTSLSNHGKRIVVEKMASFQYEMLEETLKVVTLDGKWHDERNYHETKLNGGRLEVDSYTGTSSSFHNPFIMLKSGRSGILSTNLFYGGNHKSSLELDAYGRARLIVGESDFLFSRPLEQNETYSSPFCYIAGGSTVDDIANDNHAFIKNCLLEEGHKTAKREILFNSWEGVYFSFDHDKIIEMAKKSKELGGELFVIDDGWFYKRDDDSSSLGDWEDYVSKTGGIGRLSEEIRSLGLNFGIWMEPEMVSNDSKLYKEHPDYVLRIPGKEPIYERHQLHLDLSKKEVQDYLFDKVSHILDTCKASYLKWDYNRNFTDIYQIGESKGYFDSYLKGLESLLKRLRKRWKDVVFEGCASGGSRFDMFSLSYFPQIWTSDNNDALDRYKIESSTLLAYPPDTMCCHICARKNNDTGRLFPFADRFNIALLGNLGYELNPLSLSEKEEAEIKEANAYYKRNRAFLSASSLLFLGKPYLGETGGAIFLGEKKAIAVLVAREKEAFIKLRGLKKEKRYYCEEDKKAYSGQELMRIGVKVSAEGSLYSFVTRRMSLTEID